MSLNKNELVQNIKQWGRELGFQQVGISGTELGIYEQRLNAWLEKGYHGEMAYMAKHGSKRSRPAELIPGTKSIISVRLDYMPSEPNFKMTLANPQAAFLSRYALGRDYHKVMRKRLQQLAEQISTAIGPFGYRAFCDSAPVMEKAIAEQAGLGWIGKHTNLINKRAGSWFFLGELYTDLELPADQPESSHCGSCRACIDICPTQAIVAPYQLDARRCISYLTIELRGSIPEQFRSMIGNRIYGCDDCQLICPWNKFAKRTAVGDFAPRHNLDCAKLVDLFAWSEADFDRFTQGSAIRRIGYECWLRNVAVGLGNAPSTAAVLKALQAREHHPSALVREHVQWALAQHEKKKPKP